MGVHLDSCFREKSIFAPSIFAKLTGENGKEVSLSSGITRRIEEGSFNVCCCFLSRFVTHFKGTPQNVSCHLRTGETVGKTSKEDNSKLPGTVLSL